jgi:RNA polymerase sigma factor (sigma-70 family)
MTSAKAKPRRASGITPAFLAVEASLKKYLRRYLTRAQDIEDVLQDVFIRAYESENIQEIRSPTSYLFKIAKHSALNELAKKSHQLMSYVGDVAELDVIDDELTGVQALERQERLTTLNKAIADLPPQCQKVLVMRKIYGFTHREVADHLHISVKTVEKHLTKGLQRCQQAMVPSKSETSPEEVPASDRRQLAQVQRANDE